MLRQFRVEGFVNTYHSVDAMPAGATLVFDSESFENFGDRWTARETYVFASDDQFVETFELAPPGQAFAVYSKTESKRIK